MSVIISRLPLTHIPSWGSVLLVNISYFCHHSLHGLSLGQTRPPQQHTFSFCGLIQFKRLARYQTTWALCLQTTKLSAAVFFGLAPLVFQ